MTWADFYLFCFAVGFFFSLVAVVTGHRDLDFGFGEDADLPSAGDHHVSPFNMRTAAAFLAWFGGTGYLTTRYYPVGFGVGLLASVGAGVVGAYVVYWFLARVLMRDREEMDPADYEMVGVLGQVSSPIRE